MEKIFDLIEWLTVKRSEGRIIWLFNIGTEKFWSDENYSVKDEKEELLVCHMEEMNLLLTRKQDVLILRKRPDEIYLQYMEELGYEVPEILCPRNTPDDTRTISELVLEDENLLQKLTEIGKGKDTYFVPYGISCLEKNIASWCGLCMPCADLATITAVNHKAYARKTAQELGFDVTEGKICRSYDEIMQTCNQLRKKFAKVIIKQCRGASGKGLYVIDSDRKLKSTIMILKHFHRDDTMQEWIVEGWYEKKTDINYQIYIRADGKVTVFSVKEQILDETVYIGSVIPPRISETTTEKYAEYGQKIGRYLFSKGFTGLLGVDSFITAEDVIIPVIEFNARCTLSTYLSFLIDRYPKRVIYSFYERMSLRQGTSFEVLLKMLKEEHLDFDEKTCTGVICYVSETVKDHENRHNGRFFAAVIGESMEQDRALYEKTIKVLEQIRRN